MKTYNALLFGREVRISRTLKGSIERVWDYLTRSELLERWLAAGEIGAAGSRVYLVQDSDAAPWKKSNYMCGFVVENEAPHRLAYTIKDIVDGLPEDEVEDSLVEFSLRECGSEVELEIIHSRLGREELPWVYAEWNAHLDFLQEELAGSDVARPRRMVRAPITHCLIN